MRYLLLCLLTCWASAIIAQDEGSAAPEVSLEPQLRPDIPLPNLHWDEDRAGMTGAAGGDWGLALVVALQAQDDLLQTVPEDIETWCPAYPEADRNDRLAFWAGLISALAWHESTHRETAIGGGNAWFGLIQISPATARYRGCTATTGQALLNGADNLRCGVRILSQNVLRDGVVSAGMRGVAAEWGPFHNRRKREEMRAWVSSQAYCQIPE